MYPMVCYSVFNVQPLCGEGSFFCLSLLKGTFWALLKKFFENFFIFFAAGYKKGQKNNTALGGVGN